MTAELSERCLILAPQGRDAQIAAGMLAEAGIDSAICPSLGDLPGELAQGAGFCLVTEEALHRADLHDLSTWLGAQPAWSDFPFILLTSRGGGLERNPSAGRYLKTLGNVSFLERPFHPTTLVSVSSAALRGRRRQYEARTRLAELDAGRVSLLEANERLEGRVKDRTEELERAYQKVVEESRQRQVAEEQLRQVQKLEMIGQLTGGVAHDFNNLLMAVLANLTMLRKHLSGNDAKAQRLIDGALQGANRGAALTQRLLAFARRQSLQLAPTDVVALIQGMADLIERSVGPDIDLRFQFSDNGAVAMIDPNQVELAVLNLVVNGRDAMPEGGALTIEVDRVRIGSSDDLAVGQFVRICVSDTGAGMDKATLDRAIEPFFSTKELGKGTGLGLSMIHGLAVQLHGSLRLTSEIGKGTSAALYFPATEQMAEAQEEDMLDDAPATARARILLVDDDVLISMSTAEMLQDLGHEVLEVNSGKQALALLQQAEAIDLLITDFAMPGMTGAQLIAEARAIVPDLPILLATGYAELPGGAASEIARIGKPYTQPQLAAEIAKLLPGASRRH